MATMASATRVDNREQSMLVRGRVLLGCLLMAAVLLAWAQQRDYSAHRLRDPHELQDTYYSCKIDQLQMELRQAPSIIVAGAPKCGTTTLAHWLLDHPRVLPTKRKGVSSECHFFNSGIHPREFEHLLSNGTKPDQREDLICRLRMRYLHHWPGLDDNSQQQQRVYTVDKTPDYLYSSRVPKLIKALFEIGPQRPKIIVLLRKPIDRAYSHYRMEQRMARDKDRASFEDYVQRELALLQSLGLTNFTWNNADNAVSASKNDSNSTHLSIEEKDKLYDQLSDQLQGHNFLSRGLYAVQLERWFHSGLGQDMLVLPYPELASRPQQVHSKVLEFAGMPAHALNGDLLNAKFNYNDAITEPLSNSTRQQLTAFYRQANQDLVRLLEKHGKGQEYDWQEILQ